jgi:two-component system, OmpR family, copper resistance phosphate regulon response regulator CusR
VLTREMIENHIWSYDFISASNVVDVYVRRLRRKLDDPFEIKLLETVYRAGYRLRKVETQ